MINDDTALGHDFLKVAVGNRVSDVEEYGEQDDVTRIVRTFKADHGELGENSGALRSRPRPFG